MVTDSMILKSVTLGFIIAIWKINGERNGQYRVYGMHGYKR